MPFDGRVHRGEGDWNAKPAPTRDEQDHLKPKLIWIMRTVTGRMPQRMFPASLVFQCTIPDEIEHAIGRRRERTERGRRHITYHGLRIPLARTDHPQGRPIFQRGRQVPLELLERSFAGSADQGHQQPTEDQKVLRLGTAKVLLERIEHLIYFASQK